jgi:hypothetical protein
VAKGRLLKLLGLYRPRGLVLLSGDVHFGELSAWPHRAMEPAMEPAQGTHTVPARDSVPAAAPFEDFGVVGCDRLLEVTSSGLTHSMKSSGLKTRLMSAPVIALWSDHRLHPTKALTSETNFGTIAIDWGDSDRGSAAGGPVLTVTVHSAASGEELLRVARGSCPLDVASVVQLGRSEL